MRFSILFIFLILIGAGMFWQSRPQADPFEEAGEKVIQQLKKEAALRDYRESMALDERIKETKKLTRKHPKLLEKCLEKGDYKRSNMHVHEFADGSKVAFCVSNGGIDLNNFIGTIYFQHNKSVSPQVIEVLPTEESMVGFDRNPRSVSFKFDGFYLDERAFFNFSWVPVFRTTFNCSVITKECMPEKRLKCVLDPKEAEENKAMDQYLARIDESDKKAFEDYFSAIRGDRELRKVFLSQSFSVLDEAYDEDLFNIMQSYMKYYRKAGCL